MPRRPTMADVARLAGVSPMTVSYAYGQPARVSTDAAERVRRAAAELRYPGPHPGARSLRRGSHRSIGVVLGEHLTYAFADPQAARFFEGVASVCGERGIGLTLVPVTGSPADGDRVRQAAVDGFVVWTTSSDDPVLEAVSGTGLPAVLHGSPDERDPVPAGVDHLGIDDVAAARAVGRLAFAGAGAPAVLCFPLDRRRETGVVRGLDPVDVAFPVTRHRLLGLREACRDLGLDWSAVPVNVCGTNAAAQAAGGMAALLDEPADAVAAMSDELALGALGVLRDRGVELPRQVALTGWDDTPAAGPAGLSTVRQDLREQGARCARIALGQRDSGPAPSWSVVERATTRRGEARASR